MFKRSRKAQPFDKYEYYLKSVQSPEEDADFLSNIFTESFPGKKAKTFREDFCAAFALSCAWVRAKKEHEAFGIDLDPEPIGYGKAHYLPRLTENEQGRIQVMQANVLDRDLPKVDIIAALNFSFYIFKERQKLLAYFQNCYRTLSSPGLLVIDCFGGPATHTINEDKTKQDGGYYYYWDQTSFNQITHESKFYIHYKLKGEKKRREKVFSYDWRMWSIPELVDLLKEAGFSQTHIYWEGSKRNGEGNGIFKRSTKGDDSDAWIAYISAEKA